MECDLFEEQVIINFDEIEKEKQHFEGCEYGFCCLGTTKGRSGKVWD